nr:hypothetical protein [Pectobacterium carotovorum]
MAGTGRVLHYDNPLSVDGATVLTELHAAVGTAALKQQGGLVVGWP